MVFDIPCWQLIWMNGRYRDEGTLLNFWQIQVSFEIRMIGCGSTDKLIDPSGVVEKTKGVVTGDWWRSRYLIKVEIEGKMFILSGRMFLL